MPQPRNSLPDRSPLAGLGVHLASNSAHASPQVTGSRRNRITFLPISSAVAAAWSWSVNPVRPPALSVRCQRTRVIHGPRNSTGPCHRLGILSSPCEGGRARREGRGAANPPAGLGSSRTDRAARPQPSPPSVGLPGPGKDAELGRGSVRRGGQPRCGRCRPSYLAGGGCSCAAWPHTRCTKPAAAPGRGSGGGSRPAPPCAPSPPARAGAGPGPRAGGAANPPGAAGSAGAGLARSGADSGAGLAGQDRGGTEGSGEEAGSGP